MKLKAMLLTAALAAATVGGGLNASATTYLGTSQVGSDTVQISITTDGKVGILSQSDITNYDFTIADSGNFYTINPADDEFVLQGNGLTATPTMIKYDFGDNSASPYNDGILAQNNSIPVYFSIAGFSGYNGYAAGEQVGSYGTGVPTQYVEKSGIQTIASVSAAPEPSGWLLMIAGVGIVGCLMRYSARRGSRGVAAA